MSHGMWRFKFTKILDKKPLYRCNIMIGLVGFIILLIKWGSCIMSIFKFSKIIKANPL